MVNVCYGGQACGAGDPATALTASIQNGLAYGQKFIEIYQSDVNYYPAVITWAHAALNAQ